jgi:hypothetical protein
VEDYPWSTLQILLGKKHGIIPLVEDVTLMDNPKSTLDWLNCAYLEEDIGAIKSASRKKVFEIVRDPKTLRKREVS